MNLHGWGGAAIVAGVWCVFVSFAIGTWYGRRQASRYRDDLSTWRQGYEKGLADERRWWIGAEDGINAQLQQNREKRKWRS
ncbi:MAG TPA: hypothetical protein VKW06_10500 [Candidatus Angelobacter sp.]|nr:hypothetical protein [Candidatus Angelobacter sp.]